VWHDLQQFECGVVTRNGISRFVTKTVEQKDYCNVWYDLQQFECGVVTRNDISCFVTKTVEQRD